MRKFSIVIKLFVTDSTSDTLAALTQQFRAKLEEFDIPVLDNKNPNYNENKTSAEIKSFGDCSGFWLRRFPVDLLPWLLRYCDRLDWQVGTNVIEGKDWAKEDGREFWRAVALDLIFTDKCGEQVVGSVLDT